MLGIINIKDRNTANLAMSIGLVMAVCGFFLVIVNVVADINSTAAALPKSAFGEISRQTGFDMRLLVGITMSLGILGYQLYFLIQGVDRSMVLFAVYLIVTVFDGAYVFSALTSGDDIDDLLSPLMLTGLICWFSELILVLGAKLVIEARNTLNRSSGGGQQQQKQKRPPQQQQRQRPRRDDRNKRNNNSGRPYSPDRWSPFRGNSQPEYEEEEG